MKNFITAAYYHLRSGTNLRIELNKYPDSQRFMQWSILVTAWLSLKNY